MQKNLHRIWVGIFLAVVPQVTFAAAGAKAFSDFVAQHIVQQAIFAFWGIAAAFLFFYGVRMILEANKDDATQTAGNSFLFALAGFAIMATAGAFASAFATTSFSGGPSPNIAPGILGTSINSVAQFIITLSSGVFILIITIVGIRILSSGGDDGALDKWRKVLLGNIAGVMLMMLANVAITAISTGSSSLVISELAGLALFLLTIVGFLCVIAIIVAGIMLIVSIDEGLKDKAKTTIIGTLIALGITIASYTIISTFLS